MSPSLPQWLFALATVIFLPALAAETVQSETLPTMAATLSKPLAPATHFDLLSGYVAKNALTEFTSIEQSAKIDESLAVFEPASELTAATIDQRRNSSVSMAPSALATIPEVDPAIPAIILCLVAIGIAQLRKRV
jgi:hypothetical protein